jgi:hypothetical protein
MGCGELRDWSRWCGNASRFTPRSFACLLFLVRAFWRYALPDRALLLTFYLARSSIIPECEGTPRSTVELLAV